MVLTAAEKSARYRAKDIEAYRAKKNALAKLEHHRAVRAAYAKKWRDLHKQPRKPRVRKYTDAEIKEHKRVAAAKWRSEHRAEHNATSKRAYHKYKHRYKEKIRNYNIKKKYGITAVEFDQLFAANGSVCAICDSGVARSKRGWHVDHCHKSGRVRGILCHVCNTKLGWFEKFREQIEGYLIR